VDDLHHLNQLAARLKLPRDWLRREAAHGRIPCLRVGRRLLFSLSAVAAALAERAARERLAAQERVAGGEEVVVG
jgi:excisionase family DNA binding protein